MPIALPDGRPDDGDQVMTEAELLAAVTGLCDRLGPPVVWLHLADARRAGGPYRKGLPDLLLIGQHAAMWRELKAGTAGDPETGRRLTVSGGCVWAASVLAVLARSDPGGTTPCRSGGWPRRVLDVRPGQ